MFYPVSAAVVGLPRHAMNVLRISHLIKKFKIDSYSFHKRFPFSIYLFLVFSQHGLLRR